jgi:AraC family transcriptional regulator
MNGEGPVFQKTDLVHHDPTLRSMPGEFPVDETHGIAHWTTNRLLADSRGLGWHDAYLSLASESSWTNTLRAVPHYCLSYCLHRPAEITRSIDGEHGLDSAELRPRLFGLVPPDRPSTWKLIGSPDIETVYVRRSVVDQLAEDEFGIDSSNLDLVPKLGFADGMLEQLMIALLDAARLDGVQPSNGLYADHVIRMIAMHLLRHHSNRPGRGPSDRTPAGGSWARMQHVRDLIEASLGEDLGLERLAAEAGVGAHAFSASFRRTFGMPPHRYVVHRRIERAKRLLRETEVPVAVLAHEVGFASQSHLATAFKRAVGVTPGEYRRQAVSVR